MRKAILALSLAAILLPVTACAAQTNTDTGSATSGTTATGNANGPSADVRAQMTQARNDAKNASLAVLSADHKAKVQAIVDQFNSSSSIDFVAPSKAIDAILSPSENTAVLAQEAKMRSAMAALRAANAANNPNAATPGAGNGARKRTPDAGRFLLTAMASREKMRAVRQQRSGN